MESIFKLGIILSVLDRVSGPSTRIGQSLRGLKGQAASLGPVFDKFRTYGATVAASGAIVLSALGGMAMAAGPVQKAMGELSSVGVQDLRAVSEAGRRFSNQWAGTDQAQFIAAAYDIKSGISSLSDSGVADFTRLAGVTAKATKSTMAEMTNLSATAYGIYKRMYAGISDQQWGEMFSAGMAASVQKFKTEGPRMGAAIENLGASATVAGISMQEQFAVLGKLQESMGSGEQAGTAYKAVIRDAAKAGKELGLNFYDANKQLLSLPEILTLLENKFGALDGIKLAALQKAWGDDASAAIQRLYGQVGILREGINDVGAAMRQGSRYTELMAAKMNHDLLAVMSILYQRIKNLVVIIGDQLTPVIIPLVDIIGKAVVGLQEFAMKHPVLTRVMVLSTAAIGTAALIFGTLAMAIGAVGLMVPAIKTGWASLGIAAKGLWTIIRSLFWVVTGLFTTLLANPITWVVIAVAALAVGLVWLYKRFDVVRNAVHKVLFILGMLVGGFVRIAKAMLGLYTLPMRLMIDGFAWLYGLLKEHLGILNPLTSMFVSLGDTIVNAFGKVVDFFSGLNLFENGKRIIKTLVDGVVSVINLPEKAIRKAFSLISPLLTNSDAKEGPLSTLTQSGASIMQTLGAGVQSAAPGFRRQMTAALGGMALATSVAVTPVMAAGVGIPAAAAEQAHPATAIRQQTQPVETTIPSILTPPPPALEKVRQTPVPIKTPAPSSTAPAESSRYKTSGPASKTYTIRIDRIELPRVSDASSFIRDLERFVEAHDG